MKPCTKLYILSITLITITMITGCNNPQKTTNSITPTSGINAEVKDSEVTANVKTALFADEKVKGLEIAVVTLKGDVRLTGFVDNQSQIDYIHQLVRSVTGVHSIHNELSIKQ